LSEELTVDDIPDKFRGLRIYFAQPSDYTIVKISGGKKLWCRVIARSKITSDFCVANERASEPPSMIMNAISLNVQDIHLMEELIEKSASAATNADFGVNKNIY